MTLLAACDCTKSAIHHKQKMVVRYDHQRLNDWSSWLNYFAGMAVEKPAVKRGFLRRFAECTAMEMQVLIGEESCTTISSVNNQLSWLPC